MAERDKEVAGEIGVRPNTVGRWHRRFVSSGMAELRDAPRFGKPPKYGTQSCEIESWRNWSWRRRPGMASGDSGSLARVLSVSHDAVWRVLSKESVQL